MDPELTKIILGGMASLQAITIAIMGIVLKQGNTIKKSADATKNQIVNHHPQQPNFREENDRRHAETKRWFMLLKADLSSFKQEVYNKMDRSNDRWDELSTWAIENRERIESIETTQNPKGTKS